MLIAPVIRRRVDTVIKRAFLGGRGGLKTSSYRHVRVEQRRKKETRPRRIRVRHSEDAEKSTKNTRGKRRHVFFFFFLFSTGGTCARQYYVTTMSHRRVREHVKPARPQTRVIKTHFCIDSTGGRSLIDDPVPSERNRPWTSSLLFSVVGYQRLLLCVYRDARITRRVHPNTRDDASPRRARRNGRDGSYRSIDRQPLAARYYYYTHRRAVYAYTQYEYVSF